MKTHQLINCNICSKECKSGSFYQHKKNLGVDPTHVEEKPELNCDKCDYGYKQHGYKILNKGTEQHAKKQHKSTDHFNAKNLGDF